MDAWKEDYKKFFDLTLPLLKPGGVFLAHNAISHARHMQDFLEAAKNHPALITNVIQMGRDGFCVSFKRRVQTKERAAKWMDPQPVPGMPGGGRSSHPASSTP